MLGFADGRPAVLAYDPDDPSATPSYFVLLQWGSGRLLQVRDFRYARYATEGAALLPIGQ